METVFYTARVELGSNKNFTSGQDWAEIAENYQRETLRNLTVIRNTNKHLHSMQAAIKSVYGCDLSHSWCVGSLSNYIAILDFLDSPAKRMAWVDLDLIRNMINPMVVRDGACITYPHASRHTMTDHERFKESIFHALVPQPREAYTHILSSMLVLSREDASIIVHGLNAFGFNLLTPDAWEKIREAENKILGLSTKWPTFFSDMILELAHGLCNWKPRNIFHQIDWYPTITDRPFIHFHSHYKSDIADFVNRQSVAK
jgi:hypothetical protein